MRARHGRGGPGSAVTGREKPAPIYGLWRRRGLGHPRGSLRPPLGTAGQPRGSTPSPPSLERARLKAAENDSPWAVSCTEARLTWGWGSTPPAGPPATPPSLPSRRAERAEAKERAHGPLAATRWPCQSLSQEPRRWAGEGGAQSPQSKKPGKRGGAGLGRRPPSAPGQDWGARICPRGAPPACADPRSPLTSRAPLPGTPRPARPPGHLAALWAPPPR